MPQPFFSFEDHFPAIDTDEAADLISRLESPFAVTNIWELAAAHPKDLGVGIAGFPTDHFDTFWASLNGKATDVIGVFAPSDPDNLTPDELLIVSEMTKAVYDSFPKTKTEALRSATERVSNPADNTWKRLENLSTTDATTARAAMDLGFFVALAGYYIAMASGYVSTDTRQYRFLGRVLFDDVSTATKAGVHITCVDKNGDPFIRKFGSATTDRNGLFRIGFSTLEVLTDPYGLTFTFTHKELATPEERDEEYDPTDPREPVDFVLTFEAPASSSQTIASTGITVPTDVQTYLTSQSITITKLEDIRRLGTLKNLPSDTIDKQDPDLLKLDGLASLEILLTDAGKNEDLYDRGYTGISKIANYPRQAFVAENRDILGDYGAAQMHYQAQAVHLHGLNGVASANSFPPGRTPPVDTIVGPATGCDCADCSSAVSPLAYLADLLSFTLNNLENTDGEELVDLVFLKDTFFQEFGAMPASCAQLKANICQNRIAAEVMRKYYDSIAPVDAELEEDLLNAEAKYLSDTYQLLLTKLGTSYAEIRRMRSVTDNAARKKVSDRLGIVLNDTGDTLSELFIDLSDPGSLTEATLEDIFGLRDSESDVLTPTPESSVAKWKKAWLRENWREQDGLTNVFWNHEEIILDPDVVTVDDLRDPTFTGDHPVFDLWHKRRSWIDTEWTILGTQTVEGNTTDAFKDAHMIVAYGIDYPAPANVISYSNPLLDPDPQEFNVLDQYYANGNTYYRVEQDLPSDLQNGTISVDGATPSSHSNDDLPVRSCDEMIQRLISNNTDEYGTEVVDSLWAAVGVDPAALITALRAALPLAAQGTAVSGSEVIAALGLTYASASRFLAIYDKHKLAPLDVVSQGNLTAAEWREFRDILISALKTRASEPEGTWREEEEELPLSPEFFWASVIEPREGSFPFNDGEVPLLDPDLVGANDIPEITARLLNPAIPSSTTSVEILEERRGFLTADRADIVTAHGTSFQAMLDEAFRGPDMVWDGADPSANDYLILLNRLADPTWETWALLKTTSRLKLAADELRFIVSIGTKEHAGEVVTADEMKRMYDILVRSHKLILYYAPYDGEAAGTPAEEEWLDREHEIPHWKLRKAQLPPWRSSLTRRQAWLAALEENSEAPIIDADLIGPGDLDDPIADNAAFDLWEARRVEMAGWISSISTATLESTADFNDLVKGSLGYVEDDLSVFRVQQEAGVDIRPRLAQLNLTSTEFAQLMALRDILPVPPTLPADLLTAEEKQIVQRILARVMKRRKAFTYRLEELSPVEPEDVITLSQDWFRLYEPPVGEFPPAPEFAVVPWLADQQDLTRWRRNLRSRIEQEKTVLDGLDQMLAEVDELMVVHLRDALVTACGEPSKRLVENARNLGNKLLIDLENNCCYKTNRVAAAIETLQQLLWKTRTGDILNDYDISWVGGDFDTAWTWMGSYANWRAAMFVFLYPENVLLPSLRKNQTPAFKQVIDATRGNRRFSPADACHIAEEYRAYLDDVAHLELKCVGRANTVVRERGCGVPSTNTHIHDFVFAQSKITSAPYYTRVSVPEHPNEPIDQHTFWEPVPNLDKTVRIFGCAPYYPRVQAIPGDPWQEERFLYLFFTKADPDNRDKFFALRYDLNKAQWEEEPLEFQVETDSLTFALDGAINLFADFQKGQFSSSIEAIALRQVNSNWRPPAVAVSLKKVAGVAQDIYTFCWVMQDNGKEFKPRWTGDGWRMSVSEDRAMQGRVKGYYALITDASTPSGFDDHNYSLLVLESDKLPTVRQEWTDWAADLADLEQEYDFFMEHEYSGAVDSLVARAAFNYAIDMLRAQEPRPKHTHEIEALSDYIVYHHYGAGLNQSDIVRYPLPLLEGGNPVKVTNVIPMVDRGTLLVQYTSADSSASHLMSSDGSILNVVDLPAMEASTGYRLLSPVQDTHLEDPSISALFQQRLEDDPVIRVFRTTALVFHSPGDVYDLLDPEAFPLSPRFNTVPAIHNEFTAAELPVRHHLSHTAFDINSGPNFRTLEYVSEGYFFVPLALALQLSTNGHYQEALDWFRTIYDINRPLEERKIWHGLHAEETNEFIAERVADWYRDPLNPHALAATRPHTYTRYTMLAIAQCLLAYADSLFTTDNAETVARARELYEDARGLLELLVVPDPCESDQATHDLLNAAKLGAWTSTFAEELERLERLNSSDDLDDLVGAIETVLTGSDPMQERLADVRGLIQTQLDGLPLPHTFAEVLEAGNALLDGYTTAVMGGAVGDGVALTVSAMSTGAFTQVMESVTGEKQGDLVGIDIDWLHDPSESQTVNLKDKFDPILPGQVATVFGYYADDPAESFYINSPFPNIGFSGMQYSFCVVPNPFVRALVLTSEVQLWKIHNCMNIAGMVRELDPFAAPTDSTTGIPAIGVGGTLAIPSDRTLPPSAYRYRVIVDRAKQLVAMAQQVEAAFLATLEKLDAERYSVMRAEQDVATTRAGIKLQDLKVKEANDGVVLAELQKERSQIQLDHFEGLLDAGANGFEIAALSALSASVGLLYSAAGVYMSASALGAISLPFSALFGGNALAQVAASIRASADAASSTSQLLQLFASFERRKQDWEFQRTLANQDLRIGEQGIKLAKDRVQITGQEREIAVLQSDHAKTTLDFLKNKFTSAELYEWMSGILEDVYAYFLQEATAMALLAQRQLSFERQLDLPPFVRTDYWVVDPNQLGSVNASGETITDRRGLTGSTRLLKDLYELDQYAFNSNTPKLEMSKTISLNEIAPEELMRLRDEGIATFFTTQDMFDRDYPGHYLRLIKKVSVTVIALSPPTRGIHATLTNGGVSRVVTGAPLFQDRVINRIPEQIALSSGVGDSGMFQLRAEGEFLVPFEGTGVDTYWEFRMEKAANPFDYASIADVLITIEYEALSSFTYRATVVQNLIAEGATAGLAISMKNNLPDQWFDLHNPEQASTTNQVSFKINERDVLPNMSDPFTIERLLVYVAMKDGATFPYEINLGQQGLGNGLAAVVGAIADLSGTPAVGTTSPIGEWILSFTAPVGTSVVPNPFVDDVVDDILIVFNYRGEGAGYLS